MPYFVIFPIYVALFAGGLLLGTALICFARTRRYAGFVISGTLGTLPTFIISNVLFWSAFVGIAILLKIPAEHFKDSHLVNAGAGILLIITLVGGLIVANLIGCISGFLAGCWFFAMLNKRWAVKHDAANRN